MRLFEYIYRNAELARLNEENITNYIQCVLTYIRTHKKVTYTYDKIFEINNDFIDKNIMDKPELTIDYLEGSDINKFITNSIKTSILMIKQERPQGRNIGISIKEQHLLVKFINVYKINLSLSNMDFIGKEKISNSTIEKIKSIINQNPIII
jgi:hypothetical protein